MAALDGPAGMLHSDGRSDSVFGLDEDSRPSTAKSAGIGALVAVVCIVIWYVSVFAVGIGTSMFA